jgi:hypothetical protein
MQLDGIHPITLISARAGSPRAESSPTEGLPCASGEES